MEFYRAETIDCSHIGVGATVKLESLRQAVIPPYLMLMPFVETPDGIVVKEQQALDEDGVIGVKWVKDKRVQFTPIDVVSNDVDGAWIKGLEDRVELITVGQAFVREGDEVETIAEDGTE